MAVSGIQPVMHAPDSTRTGKYTSHVAAILSIEKHPACDAIAALGGGCGGGAAGLPLEVPRAHRGSAMWLRSAGRHRRGGDGADRAANVAGGRRRKHEHIEYYTTDMPFGGTRAGSVTLP